MSFSLLNPYLIFDARWALSNSALVIFSKDPPLLNLEYCLKKFFKNKKKF